MRTFVAIQKESAKLALVYRIYFSDADAAIASFAGYSVFMSNKPAWAVYRPDVSPVPLVVSPEQFELAFEMLGEL